MNFPDATLMSVSRKSQFFGETTRYKSTLDITIEGLLLSLTNAQGVSEIIQKLKSVAASANNWDDIIINGNNFGKGIINSVNFSEGNDVRTKKYNISISIPQIGDLSNVVSDDYAGLSYNNFQYIDGFSENSTYDRTIQKENYSQSLSFNIRGPYSLNAVTAAKAIAQSFFQKNDLINTLGNKYSDSTIFRKFYSESYDEINNRFSFSRNYEVNKDSNGQYSVYRTHSIAFGNDGIAGIKERAEYLGHTATPFDTVYSAANTDIATSYSRCNDIFNAYELNNGQPLSSNPLSKIFTSIPFEGRITYDISYGNSLRIKSTYFHDINISVERSMGDNYTIIENANIIGFGHMIDIKYANAVSAWKIEKQNIFNRLNSYYNGSRQLKFASESVTLQKVEGRISYNTKYTDSDALRASTDIRKALITISKDFNRNLASSFNIINQKEIVQIKKNLLPNTISYNINMNGRADVSIERYLAEAKTYVSAYDSNSFISDVSYNYDPFGRSFSLSLAITSLPSA